MIQRLKIKFIILSMSALLVLLTVIVAGMNLINYNSVIEDADFILTLLSQNKGNFPDFNEDIVQKPNNKFPPQLSPEIPHESRYFSVFYNEEDDVIKVDVNKISAVDREKAILLAQSVNINEDEKGFVGEYRYLTDNDLNGKRITFLDCGRKLEAFDTFLISSILMSVCGYLLVFIIIFVLANRIVEPISKTYEKQKRFITDAGHEIKTPLTIINANADILEMELSKPNECLADIKEQTKRLKILTEDLVTLARLEENENKIEKIDFPFSDIVTETVNSFKGLALKQNKELICDIEPMITLYGNDKSIRQLISILLDNALKYSNAESQIEIELTKQNRTILLCVRNTTKKPINQEQLKLVFDRFYRTDASRNSQTGGYGIGLSIARAIVDAHNGKIKAVSENENSFTITAMFNT